MYFFKHLIILFSICFTSHSIAKSFVCDGTIRDYAMELIKEEFAGKRSGKSSSCLKQSNFNYIRPISDPILKLPKGALALTPVEESLKIVEIKELDKDVGTYRVYFSVKATPEDKKEMIEHKDSIIFILENDEKWGCALIISSPESLIVKESCK